jgi:hypothetical protein
MPVNLITEQAHQDVIQAAETLSQEIQRYSTREDIAQLLSAEPKFKDTVNNLIGILSAVTNNKTFEIDAVNPVMNINANAVKLLDVTRTWATLHDALEQRLSAKSFMTRLSLAMNLLESDRVTDDVVVTANTIGDQVVEEFYKIAFEKNLNLRDRDTKLITVLREDRVHSEAFGEPTPFIVGPLWGYNQAWNYISYAHEAGHHLYRNVDGLNCEILVNVMLTLGANKCTRAQIRTWGSWLEEIFADLFCLFRVGPAAIHAGQRVALWLGASSSRGQSEADIITDVLLTSRDPNHPVPYLRIYLGLEAVRLFEGCGPGGKGAQEQVKILTERWDDLAQHPTDIYVNDRKEDFQKILSIGQLVLKTILMTPLISLAERNDGTSTAARSVLDTFYEDDRFVTGNVDIFKNFLVEGIITEDLPRVPPQEKKNWSVLAAAELARDDVRDEKWLQNLQQKTVENLQY